MATRRPRNAEIGVSEPDYGSYIVLGGERIELQRHETDFEVVGAAPALEAEGAAVRRQGSGRARMRVASTDRNRIMEEVRETAIASHVYVRPDSGEELTFGKRILVKLRHNDPELLGQILEQYPLKVAGTQGGEYVLELTPAAEENPLKIANRIAEVAGVDYAQPEPLVRLQSHGGGVLESRQWYLSAVLTGHPDVLPTAGIECPGAWMMTRGAPEIVVAVIDDGFQLTHPAFKGKTIHPAARDFAGADAGPSPETGDYHGTPVASIAIGSDQGGAMCGVAPGCTFLPIRIGFGGSAAFDMLEVFRHASQHADVVNCSFGFGPSTMPLLSPGFQAEIEILTKTGGRRGKGLVMVFSAANDDVPTYLPAASNTGGIRYTRRNPLSGATEGASIGAGKNVYSGYPMIPGVIVAGASSSLKRKSGYSNWGPHITVVAPSNNTHYNMAFLPAGHPMRTPFVASYRGLGQVAASNRGQGAPFSPLPDNAATAGVREDDYTERFGGTSGAAPVVSGVAALMLSVNPALTANQVRAILMATADRDMDTTLDLAADPNIVPNTGGRPLGFDAGRSLLFGSGKVNARRAVEQARSLAPAPAVAAPAEVQPLTMLRSQFCVIQGTDEQGNLIVTGLSDSIDQACANTLARVIPDCPRSPAGTCGTKPIWQLFVQ